MNSLYKICVTLIEKTKLKQLCCDEIVNKIDIYFGADKLTEEEYKMLLIKINQ